MAAGQKNFTIEQGCDWAPILQWTQADGTPINIDGYTIRMMARADYDDEAPVISLSTTGEIAEAEIEAGGLGYTALDVLTVAGGTGGTVRVDSVGLLGEVTAITILTVGSAYESEVKATTGGTGAGCTLDITALLGITILDDVNGIFQPAITSVEAALLNFSEIMYDLEMESGAGVVTRLLEGTLTLSKEITK